MTWRTFVHAHWPALVAADFFTTDVWTARGLVTYYTAFVLELHSRRVQVIGSTPFPDETFVIQCPIRAWDRTLLDYYGLTDISIDRNNRLVRRNRSCPR